MAIAKFTNSFAPKPWFEKIVDLATGLEAALSGTDKTDVTLRICTRAAIILSTDTDPAPTIFADMKALYDLRSKLVHGAIITQKELKQWLAKVSAVSAPEDCMPRMRIEQLVDRLRDLVRRSILMRLLLNSDGRWPLRGDPPPVDQLWTDPAVAEQWRAAWHQGAADLGAPDAARPASPLCDSVFDDYPGKDGLRRRGCLHPTRRWRRGRLEVTRASPIISPAVTPARSANRYTRRRWPGLAPADGDVHHGLRRRRPPGSGGCRTVTR
jgi:Apea-like HEPN